MEATTEQNLRGGEMVESTQENSRQVATLKGESLFETKQREARIYASSPLIPEHLRSGGGAVALANCYVALQMAELLEENPLVVMQNIYFVGGRAGWNASYMIARANKSGIFRDPIDWDPTGEGDRLSVTAFAYVKSTGKRVQATASMEMAKAEGWTKNPKYKSMPEQMLRYRSATLLIRCYCPQVMLGGPTHTVDELEDVRASRVESSQVIDLPEVTREAPQMPRLDAKPRSGQLFADESTKPLEQMVGD